jgi:hypothetical protein
MGKSSASPGIDDCLALIGRADVHLKALERRLDRFLRSDAYSIDARVDPQAPSIDDVTEPFGRNWRQGLAGPDTPIEMVLIGHVRRFPPSRAAGLLIADAVNNLRAALDNLIWLLSIKAATRPPDPIPKRSPWRTVGWPVVLQRSDWEGACRSRLQFVDPMIFQEIERFQPFSRREHDPERDEFAVLNELWNTRASVQYGGGIDRTEGCRTGCRTCAASAVWGVCNGRLTSNWGAHERLYNVS